MGHYTIRTNDDEDQAIKKAQEATGQASASKTFMTAILELQRNRDEMAQLRRELAQEKARSGLAPIFPYTFYHLTHYWFAAADIPVANDTPVHYADAIRCNVRRPPQGSLPLLTRRVSA